MKRALLQYIVCPSCRGRLTLDADASAREDIAEGALICLACGGTYPIRSGVPRLLPPQLPSGLVRTSRAFGYEWRRFQDGDPKHAIEFWSYLTPLLDAEAFRDKIVLDAGCGMGKFALQAARCGARAVIAIDLSEAVEAAQALAGHLPNVHVVQADILHLPFRDPFDLIYSIGVLHHLPDPEEGFRLLVHRHLHVGGAIFVWLYGFEGNWAFVRFVDPLRRLTSRLPLPLNEALAKLVAGALWAAVKCVYCPFDRRGWRFLPLHDYFLYFHGLGWRFFWGTVFDKMIPPYAAYYTRDEVLDWFGRADLLEVEVADRNKNSWRALGKKRAQTVRA